MIINKTVGHENDSGIGVSGTQGFSEIINTSSRIKGVLDFGDQIMVRNSQNRLDELLLELKIEAERISSSIGYLFLLEGYNKRLSQSKTLLINESEKLIKNNKGLNNIITEILSLFKEGVLKDTIIYMIYDNYIFDLVFENLDEKSLRPSFSGNVFKLENRNLSNDQEIHNFLSLLSTRYTGFNNEISVIDLEMANLLKQDIRILSQIFSYLQSVYSVKFSDDCLLQASYEQLGIIFGAFKFIRYLNLSDFKLEFYDNKSLEIMFQKFNNLKSISFLDNLLCNVSDDSLEIIFRNLSNIRFIILAGNKLGKLSSNGLKYIFEKLKKVRVISLAGNYLGKLDNERLKIVFENLDELTYISLHSNNLNCIDSDGLRIVFENFKNVTRIDLGFNFLGKLNIDQLETIFNNLSNAIEIDFSGNLLNTITGDNIILLFSKLNNAKTIRLGGNNLSPDKFLLIRQLLPNTRILD